MRTRIATAAAAAAIAVGLTAGGCGGSGASPEASAPGSATSARPASPPASPSLQPSTPAPGPTPATASGPTPATAESTSSARLAPALITLADLPSGFHTEPLTARNLPSLIHGCAGLEELQSSGIGDQAQGEWTRGPLDSYIDEAVIQPKGDTAAGLVEKSAAALNACGSVVVTEEGLSVKLTATPLALAKVGDASHAWHTVGAYAGIPMQMNVVLIQSGGLVVLLAQTHIAGATDDALTLQAARAAVARASAYQSQ